SRADQAKPSAAQPSAAKSDLSISYGDFQHSRAAECGMLPPSVPGGLATDSGARLKHGPVVCLRVAPARPLLPNRRATADRAIATNVIARSRRLDRMVS